MNSIREFGLNIYLSASKGLESCFEAFFPFPRGWKAVLRHFFHFQGVGKSFFSVFRSSKGLESHFFSFLLIQGVGRPVFPIFCSSKGSESHFFQFFVHPSSRKAIFFNFLLSRGLGRSFFLFFTPIVPSKPKQILKPNSHNSIGNTYGQGCCVHFCFSALLRIYKRLLEVSS